jgi:hypothetical protein
MPKWKVMVQRWPYNITGAGVNATLAEYGCEVYTGMSGRTVLRGYKIESVGGVPWEKIPSGAKEENSSGCRFIYLAKHRNITQEDFDIEIVEEHHT